MQAAKRLIVKLLRSTADKIDSGNCELSEDEVVALMKNLAHIAMSKEEASIYLGLSRSRFDDYVRKGKLPKGKKRMGFKELVWYRDELDDRVVLLRGGR